MTNARYVTAADAFDFWRDEVLAGTPPTLYRVADTGPLARIEIGPNLITLFGGPPGAGKTSLVMQLITDGLRLNPTLRAVVCNIEMPPKVLLDRQLARISGVPLDCIRYRRLGLEHAERIEIAFEAIEGLAERLCFVRPPFDLTNIAEVVDEFAPLDHGGGLLLALDYIQRIAPPGAQGDKRGSVDATMNHLRRFADAGAAVIVVSSVGRQKDSKGRSTYHGDSMSLASFKESGELEFGADDALILASDSEDPGMRVLKHLKARHTEPCDLSLRFDGSTQRFDAIDDEPAIAMAISPALEALWHVTDADDTDEADE